MADGDNNGNGRITLALVVQKLDQLADKIDRNNQRMLECYMENRDNIKAEHVRVNTLERRADVNDEQHKQMRQDSTTTTIVGSVTAAVTGALTGVVSLLQQLR